MEIMKIILLNYILFGICLNLACTGAVTSQPENKSQAAKTEETKSEKKIDAELQKEVEEIAALAKGNVGVAAEVLETGDTVSLKAADRFPMQSVYKLPIAMAFVKQIDEGKYKLEQRIRIEKSDFVRVGMASPIRDRNPNGAELTTQEILKFAVSDSDGTASDVLFKLLGGSEAMVSRARNSALSRACDSVE